jgi:hypothetical protein
MRARVSGIARLGFFGLLFAASAGQATPITVGGAGGPSLTIDPLYFVGFDEFGLESPGNGPAYRATAPVPFLSVGNAPNMDLTISQALQQPAWQHPQDPANSLNPDLNGGVPFSPSVAVPLVADSLWTIRNDTGRLLEDVLLLFTKTRAIPNYPPVDAALDDFLIDTIEYTSTDGTVRWYGALPLGDLAPGATTQVLVRYIVADPVPLNGDTFLLPSLGVAALDKPNYIPEPGTLVMLAFGVSALCARRRR